LAEMARKRLTEVGAAVVRSAPGSGQVDGDELRMPLDEHGDGARPLGLFAARAALILGDVRGDDDGELSVSVAGDLTKCVLERVNAAQAGVLELRHLELP